MFRRRAVRLATVAAVVLALAAGIAYAAIPDPDGKIHGCYGVKGNLRVIDPAVSGCDPKETPITLHQFSGTPAGGDLAGNYPNPGIANKAVTPSNGNIIRLKWIATTKIGDSASSAPSAEMLTKKLRPIIERTLVL